MPSLEAVAAVEIAEFADGSQVIGLKIVGVDLQAVGRFRLFEFDHAAEGEIHFGFVENVEQNDVVAAMPQPAERLQ